MSEQISSPAVGSSRWQIAFVAFTALGASIYGFGRWASLDDSGTFPAQLIMLTIMLGPVVSVAGFGLWWIIWGDGQLRCRLLKTGGALLAFAGAIFAADSTIRPFAGVWGVPLAVGITGLALLLIPALRYMPFAAAVWLTAMAPWLALRLDGVTGAFSMQTSYRWNPSVAEKASDGLANRATVVPTKPATPTAHDTSIPLPGFNMSVTTDSQDVAVTVKVPWFHFTISSAPQTVTATAADWPGFRGSRRDGVVPAVAAKNWNGAQPRELWRKDGDNSIGAAWSSFCIVGDYVFTQEQRGNSESVVCYRADTGEEVWARGEPGKHTDPPSGFGPRATPTYSNDRIFAISATGTLSCLKFATGEPDWTVNLAERFGAKKPVFGLATSPLVMGDTVIINAASPDAPRLAAVSTKTGKTLWTTDAKGTDGYSSPHPATIAGVPQVLLFNGAGLFGHDPATGNELWRYDWVTAQNEPTTVQPLVLPDGRVVIGGGNMGIGTRCVSVAVRRGREAGGWAVAEVWRTKYFTPKFNDVVRVGEYLYGHDGGILACISLADGSRIWKDGRYGAGQLLLVGDKLLVVSETGELACVTATPDQYEELWKIKAVKGKTWNHPAIAHGRLFVRNATEMVVYDLAEAKK
jgi:outer membrane protein assembly factor BamB